MLRCTPIKQATWFYSLQTTKRLFTSWMERNTGGTELLWMLTTVTPSGTTEWIRAWAKRECFAFHLALAPLDFVTPSTSSVCSPYVQQVHVWPKRATLTTITLYSGRGYTHLWGRASRTCSSRASPPSKRHGGQRRMVTVLGSDREACPNPQGSAPRKICTVVRYLRGKVAS